MADFICFEKFYLFWESADLRENHWNKFDWVAGLFPKIEKKSMFWSILQTKIHQKNT